MKFKELLQIEELYQREDVFLRILGARFSVDSARYLTCFIGFSAFATGFLRNIGPRIFSLFGRYM